jgi:hypothetical protein
VLCCVAIAALALLAPRRPRLAQLSFLVLAAFLLTNKVYSPQYVVWLVPLAALARPRWRDFLIWQAAEVLHWAGTWLYLVSFTPAAADRALSEWASNVVVLAHVVATAWFSGSSCGDRDIRPELDVVVPTAPTIRRRVLRGPRYATSRCADSLGSTAARASASWCCPPRPGRRRVGGHRPPGHRLGEVRSTCCGRCAGGGVVVTAR